MFTSVAQANAAVIEQIRRARPHWLDVQPASSLISELNEGKTLLHAGPPMRWQEMTGPMKGACVGACLFEGWAKDEAQALAMLEQGEVNFIPCHHVNAVGPMGGICLYRIPRRHDGACLHTTAHRLHGGGGHIRNDGHNGPARIFAHGGCNGRDQCRYCGQARSYRLLGTRAPTGESGFSS